MLFYFLTIIVFIAEIIIALAIVFHLIKFDKVLNKYNVFLVETKPLIKDMAQTVRKISERYLEMMPKIVDKLKLFVTNIIKDQLKGLVGALTFWLVKKEVEKHI